MSMTFARGACTLAALATLAAAGAASAQEAPVFAAETATSPGSGTLDSDGPEPLWEVGLIGFGLRGPDYPASSEISTNSLVVPYVLYRGEVFRLEEEGGARVVPVDTPRFEVALSAGAAFGADSDGNEAREGLPDLDPLGELGLQVIARGPTVPHRNGAASRLEASVALRGVFSIDTSDLGTEYRGVVVEPRLRYRRFDIFGGPVDLSLRLSSTFATEALHDYFYQVDPEFARAGRPAFDAEGGYLSSDFGASLAWDVTGRLRTFLGVSVSSYAGAANDDSPLFEDELTTAVFAGLAFSFLQSDREVVRRR